MPSAAAPAPSCRDYLDRAKKYYHERAFEKAKTYFEKACLSCPCSKRERLRRREYVLRCQAQGVKPRQPNDYIQDHCCGCKNLLAGLTSGLHGLNKQSITSLASRPCACSVAAGTSRCTGPCGDDLHVAALDGLCACLETMGVFESSFDGALVLIQMAPARPEGYLRAAKMVSKISSDRLHTAASGCRSVDEARRSICRHGLANMTAPGSEDARAKRKLLQRILASSGRADPLARLPRELLLMILGHLSLKDKLTCQRVSKTWRGVLCSSDASRLWQSLELDAKVKPSTAALGRLFRLSNGIRDGKIIPTTKIVKIRDWEKFALDTSKLGMLTRLPNLEVLELRHPCAAQASPRGRSSLSLKPPTFSQATTMANLKRLVLDALEQPGPGSVPSALVQLTALAPRLETLEINEYHTFRWSGPFPHLKVLKISILDRNRFVDIGLHRFPDIFPTLEQIYADGIHVQPAPTDEDVGTLSKLKTLVIGCLRGGTLDSDAPATGKRMFPVLPDTLRVLDLGASSRSLVHEILFNYAGPLEQPTFSQLEAFRLLDNDYDADAVLELLKPGMESGTLRVMDVALPRSPAEHLVRRLGYESAIAATVDQFAAPDLPLSSITTVGMPRYVTRNTRSYYSNHTASPFVDWVARFPSVHTVRFYPEAIGNSADAMAGLVKLPGIKRIFQSCLTGVLRDEVLAHARKVGVEIIDTPDPWFPARFPC